MAKPEPNNYSYEYWLDLELSLPAREHRFEWRGAPVLTSLLRPSRFLATTTPVTALRVRRDPWGNLVYSGESMEAHHRWSVHFAGTGAWTGVPDTWGPEQEWQNGEGPLTAWGPALARLWEEWGPGRAGSEAGVASLSNLLARRLEYQPGGTSARTPAQRAAALGLGVCQDWAHIFLALWRRTGGRGRYVAGLAQGEGQTHAWVEVVLGGLWVPWDPLRRTSAVYGYLPLARGRDASDCPLNRGVFRGGGTQTLTVRAALGPALEVVR